MIASWRTTVTNSNLAPCRLLFVLVLLILARASIASSLSFSGTDTTLNLGQNILYQKDPNASLSKEALLSGQYGNQWQVYEGKTPNFGLDPSVYWFKQSVTISPGDKDWPRPLFIEIAYPALDMIELTLVQNGRVIQHHRTGDHLPFASRPISHRNFLFPLVDYQSDTPITVLVKLKTAGALQMPLYLWDQVHFWEQDQMQLMGQAFFVAVVLTIGLYNLMLFLSMRDTVYLLYVAYIICLTLTQVCLHGINYQIVVPHSPFLNERMLLISSGLSVFFACVFAWKFMALGQTRPKTGRFLLMVGVIGLIQAFTGIAMDYAINLKTSIIIIALACPILLIIGFIQWRSGMKVARFFTLAWTVYLIGQFALTLSKLALIPRTTLVEFAPEIGAGMEVILLSFALADRMNEERQKRFAAQQTAFDHEKAARLAKEEALNIQHRANEELEARVEARTLELKTTLDELSIANDKLKDLSTIDGLTQVSNRRAFNDTLENEWRRCMRDQLTLSVLLLDADHFKQINDTFGHQSGDECLKHIAQTCVDNIRRPGDCAARYGGEEFAVILPNTPSHGAVAIAERIRSLVATRTVTHEGNNIPITVSIGIASVVPNRHAQPNSLVEAADKALYQAKEQGRNQVATAQKDVL